ncbi:MAG: hypothetical protein ACQETE_12535 [Bacteroidota bacterium]
MKRAPWSDIGRLQSEMQQIKNDVRTKADSHELSSINRRMDNLEHSMRELSAKVDGVLSELRQLQEDRRLNQP